MTMTEITIIEAPVISPDTTIDISSKLKQSIEVEEESQVVLHCCFRNLLYGRVKVRIWQSTFLYDLGSSHISKLVHVENITMYPNRMFIAGKETVFFTLIFTGLPKTCTLFNMIEKIPESSGANIRESGFYIPNIERNCTDVYFVDIQ